MSRKIALLVDFGGVISCTLFETHDETERVLGLPRGTIKWRGPLDPEGDPLWRSMQRGEIHEHDYWRQRAREVGALAGEVWAGPIDYMRRVRGADPNYAIRPEAIATIERLKSRGVRMVMLSNGVDAFYGADVRQRMKVLAHIDAMVDATYTGVMKPDPHAYQQGLDAAQARADQAVFVDDQPANVAGAERCGIASVQFDVTQPAASWARVEALFTEEP